MGRNCQMSNKVQKRVNRLLELYFSKDDVESDIVFKFRAWFENAGHVEEKDKALTLLFESQMGFDPNPSAEVIASFDKICKDLGLPLIENVLNVLLKPKPAKVKLHRTMLWKVAAILIFTLVVGGISLLQVRKNSNNDMHHSTKYKRAFISLPKKNNTKLIIV